MKEEIQDVVTAKLAEMKEDFAKLGAEMKAAVAKEIEEKTKTGQADPETMEKIVKMEAKFRELEQEILRPERKHVPAVEQEPSFGAQLTENEDFKSWAKEDFGLRAGRRRMAFPLKGGLGLGLSQKAVITTGGLGSGTSGVLEQQRQSEFIRLPRQALRIRDLMRVRTMVGMNVDYLKQNVWTSAASPQTEGSTKGESTLTYTTATASAKTIAHWLQVTRQALADMPELRADIDSQMLYGLKLKEESEILSGDGLGSHLNGVITQATAYASGTYNVAGDTKLDKLRHAILQVRLALFPSDAIVLNPRDMHDIELIKDLNGGSANTGRYILGDPSSGIEVRTVWGRPVVESDSIPYGSFLVGAFAIGADLFDRMAATIEISFENGTNFVENEATILCEERIALAVKQPGSFVYGTF